MNIKSVSMVTEFRSNQYFTGENKKKSNGIKTALPATALALSLITAPVGTNEVKASEYQSDNIEMQAPRRNYNRPVQNHRPTQRPPQQHRPTPRPQPQHHQAPGGYRPRPVVPYHPAPMPHPYYYHNPYRWVLPSLIMMDYINSINELQRYYNSPVSISGVAFNKNDVVNVEKYNDNSTQYTSVTMTDGTNVTYPSQYLGRYALVRRGEGGYIFEGLANAYITGSDRSDKYTLKGCQHTTVDVGSDDRIDNVRVTKYRIIPQGVRQYTQSVEVIAGGGDNVNGQRVYDYQTLTYEGY